MYIDERLLKILETHKGETADVNFIISLIKTIAKEYETEQLRIGGVMFELPDNKEIIKIGMELAKQGKKANNKASIKDYLFGFIDGFRYIKDKIESKGN